MKKPTSCLLYIAIATIAGAISIVSILLYRNLAMKRAAIQEPIKIRLKMPGWWEPYGETTAGPEVIEAPSTEYTAGDTTTPVEPKKEPRDPLVAPPGTLGEGGDVRELMPWIDIIGPEPGSAASEACEESTK